MTELHYCSDGGDSSTLSGQTLLCSGIIFALESEVPGSNRGAGTDSAPHTSLSLMADPRVWALETRPYPPPHLWSIFFDFMRFSGENCQINRLVPL